VGHRTRRDFPSPEPTDHVAVRGLLTEAEVESRVRAAGRRVLEFRQRGFHCSESVFQAINDALDITDPAMVRIVTGFHGGGGIHRTQPGIDIASVLREQRSGERRYRGDEVPLVRVGHLCGALAAGIVCIGLLYGRRSPDDDLNCVDELCYKLHRRFFQEFHGRECQFLRENYVPMTPKQNCETIYRKATEMTVELLLTSSRLVPECSGARTRTPKAGPA